MYTLGLLYITLIWKKSVKSVLINKLTLLLVLIMWLNNNWIYIEINQDHLLFNNNLKVYKWILLILLLTILSFWLNNKLNNDLYILYSTLGSIIILLSNNKLLFIISLEIQSFSIYILVSQNNSKSLSSLNYYILGSVSSVIILLGLERESLNLLLITGLIMKLSIYPLSKYWVEIYNKISLIELIHVINIPKVSILLWLANNGLLDKNKELILLLSLLTQVYGAIGALYNSSLQKVITYSSINQTALILIMIVLLNNNVVLLYIFQYIITIIILIKSIGNNNWISELKWNNNYNKYVIVLNLLSLLSIPITLNFYGKWYVIELTLKSSEWLIITVLLVTTIIIGYLYLKLINIGSKENNNTNTNINTEILSSLLTLVVVLLILDKEWVIHLVEYIEC